MTSPPNNATNHLQIFIAIFTILKGKVVFQYLAITAPIFQSCEECKQLCQTILNKTTGEMTTKHFLRIVGHQHLLERRENS